MNLREAKKELEEHGYLLKENTNEFTIQENLNTLFNLVKKIAALNGYKIKQEDQKDRFYITKNGIPEQWAIRVMKRYNDPVYEDCLMWTPYNCLRKEVPKKAKSMYMDYFDDHIDDLEDLKKDDFVDSDNFYVWDILDYIKNSRREIYKFEHPFLSKIYNKYDD